MNVFIVDFDEENNEVQIGINSQASNKIVYSCYSALAIPILLRLIEEHGEEEGRKMFAEISEAVLKKYDKAKVKKWKV